MYTQCPECRKQHSVSSEDLRATRGMIKCTQCSAMFDALEYITDELPIADSDNLTDSLFPEAATVTSNRFWLYGFCFGLLALITQFFYFEAYALSQNHTLRPWLVTFCDALRCDLPDYKNAGEISVLKTTLEPGDTPNYRFKAVITNQSAFSQPYPHVRLTLLDFTGEAMLKRVFSPTDYQAKSSLLASDDSAEIIIDIAVPNKTFGGYSFKLL